MKKPKLVFREGAWLVLRNESHFLLYQKAFQWAKAKNGPPSCPGIYEVFATNEWQFSHWNGRFWGCCGPSRSGARLLRDHPTHQIVSIWRE